jgi:hypothetical protein
MLNWIGIWGGGTTTASLMEITAEGIAPWPEIGSVRRTNVE